MEPASSESTDGEGGGYKVDVETFSGDLTPRESESPELSHPRLLGHRFIRSTHALSRSLKPVLPGTRPLLCREVRGSEGGEDEGGTPRRRRSAFFVDVDAAKAEVKANLSVPTTSTLDLYKTEGWAQRVVRSNIFERVTLAVIACNAAWITVDTDCNEATLFTDAHWAIQVAEHSYCLYSAVEIVIRFLAFNKKRGCLRDTWSMLDAFLSGTFVLETWVMTAIIVTCGGDGLVEMPILRIASLLRLRGIFRVVRLLRAVPELMIMVKGMLAAMRSVFLTVALLLVIMYVFGIASRQLTTDSSLGEQFFGYVTLPMYTLAPHGTLREDVSPLADPLLDESFASAALFSVFILLAAFSVMNVLIGVLCEVVGAVAAAEREEFLLNYVRGKMKTVIEQLDTEGDRRISKTEVAGILASAQACRALREVGVDVMGLIDCAEDIFLDSTGTRVDSLSPSDIMEIVLQLRGSNTAAVKEVQHHPSEYGDDLEADGDDFVTDGHWVAWSHAPEPTETQPDVVSAEYVCESTGTFLTGRRVQPHLRTGALALLGFMSEPALAPAILSCNAALSACEKGGQCHLEWTLLGSPSGRWLRPDAITRNAAISIGTKGGRWQLALTLLGEMPALRCLLDVISCNAAISACAFLNGLKTQRDRCVCPIGHGIITILGAGRLSDVTREQNSAYCECTWWVPAVCQPISFALRELLRSAVEGEHSAHQARGQGTPNQSAFVRPPCDDRVDPGRRAHPFLDWEQVSLGGGVEEKEVRDAASQWHPTAAGARCPLGRHRLRTRGPSSPLVAPRGLPGAGRTGGPGGITRPGLVLDTKRPSRRATTLEVNSFHVGAAPSACAKGSRWSFALDLIQSMPGPKASLRDICIVGIDWTMTALNHGGPTEFMRLGKTASRLTRLVRLLGFMEMTQQMLELMARINSEYILTVIGLVNLVVLIVIANHYIAWFWYGPSKDIRGVKETWVNYYLIHNGKVDLAYSYATSLHWSEQDSVIRHYFSENNIPHSLALKVWPSVRQKRVSGKRIRAEDLPFFQLLPVRLRDELLQGVYTPHLLVHPLLRACWRVCPAAVRKMCIKAVAEVALTCGKTLDNVSDALTKMVFDIVGSLEFHPFTTEEEDRECPKVERGSWAGELALWADRATLEGHLVAAPGGAGLMLLDVEVFGKIALEFAEISDLLASYSKVFMEHFAAAMFDNAAISPCEKSGQWPLALALIGALSELGLMPSVSTCSAGGQWHLALALLGLMSELGLEPNVISCNAAFSTCEKGGQGQLVWTLLGSSSGRWFTLHAMTCNAAISACTKGGRWPLALALSDEMSVLRCLPDAISCNAAISACEKAKTVAACTRPVQIHAQCPHHAHCNHLQCSHQRVREWGKWQNALWQLRLMP